MSESRKSADKVDQQPEFEEMTAADWREYLTQHPGRRLVINARDGLHSVEYDRHEGRVTFYAHGSKGYDEGGTFGVLSEIAGSSSGLEVVQRDDNGVTV